jgi:hypothetical protein
VVALEEGTTSLPQRTSRSLTQGMVAGIVALPITQERKEVEIPTLFSAAKRFAHYSSARGCVRRLDGRPTSAMDTRPQQTIDQVPPTSQGLVALVNPPPPAFLESSFNFEGASTVVTTNVKTLYFDQGHIELWPTSYFDQGDEGLVATGCQLPTSNFDYFEYLDLNFDSVPDSVQEGCNFSNPNGGAILRKVPPARRTNQIGDTGKSDRGRLKSAKLPILGMSGNHPPQGEGDDSAQGNEQEHCLESMGQGAGYGRSVTIRLAAGPTGWTRVIDDTSPLGEV